MENMSVDSLSECTFLLQIWVVVPVVWDSGSLDFAYYFSTKKRSTFTRLRTLRNAQVAQISKIIVPENSFYSGARCASVSAAGREQFHLQPAASSQNFSSCTGRETMSQQEQKKNGNPKSARSKQGFSLYVHDFFCAISSACFHVFCVSLAVRIVWLEADWLEC